MYVKFSLFYKYCTYKNTNVHTCITWFNTRYIIMLYLIFENYNISILNTLMVSTRHKLYHPTAYTLPLHTYAHLCYIYTLHIHIFLLLPNTHTLQLQPRPKHATNILPNQSHIHILLPPPHLHSYKVIPFHIYSQVKYKTVLLMLNQRRALQIFSLTKQTIMFYKKINCPKNHNKTC